MKERKTTMLTFFLAINQIKIVRKRLFVIFFFNRPPKIKLNKGSPKQ